jgi:uncharacterized protein YaaR (DUF327 family)
MKIQSNIGNFGQNIQRGEATPQQQVQNKSFSDTMQQHDEQTSKDQLNRMMQQIDIQSGRLAKSMTVRELRAYKLLIKQFLEETVRRGVSLRDTKGWDRRGRGKRYKLLEEVDVKLLEMGEELLEHEQGRIDLLDKIGEIRGMLLNVYF